MGQVTKLLQQATEGDQRALDAVLPIVEKELHARAEHLMRAERPGHTLQPTALVHEAYLRLVDQRQVRWQSPLHFIALALGNAARTPGHCAHPRPGDRAITATGDGTNRTTDHRARGGTTGSLLSGLNAGGVSLALGEILLVGRHIHTFLVNDDFIGGGACPEQ